MLWWPKNKTKSATNEKVILPPRKRLPWVKTKTISATNDLVDRCGISVSQNDHGYVHLVVSTSRSFPHS